MSGKEHIFSAEAAYYSFDMNVAEQHAYRALYTAKENAQHDLVCNSYALLAWIGLMQGDFSKMTLHIQNAAQYAETCDVGVIKEIRDTVLGWYYVKLHDDGRIPQSIATLHDESRPRWTYGRSQIVFASHLIHSGEYARLVGMLEYPKGLYLIQGISPDRITLYIILAIGYYHLGNLDAAMEALWTAYTMSWDNGLITLFIEAEHHMTALIEQAREQHTYTFSSKWLDSICDETVNFTKRANAVRQMYHKQALSTAPNNPLSKRERQILQALSQGMTR